jgi:hypothetical protein
MKPTMKTWVPVWTETAEERTTMIQGVIREISRTETDDDTHTVYVGGDTLVYGTRGDDGEMHIFECKILSSTLDPERLYQEGEAVVSSNGRPS